MVINIEIMIARLAYKASFPVMSMDNGWYYSYKVPISILSITPKTSFSYRNHKSD